MVTVVDEGDGVLSLLRSTNHTATAIARRTTTTPAINRRERAAPAAASCSLGLRFGTASVGAGRPSRRWRPAAVRGVFVRIGQGDDVGHVVGLRPGQTPKVARTHVLRMDFRRHLGGAHRGGRRCGRRAHRFGHGRRALFGGPAGGVETAADRRGQLGLRSGDDRHPEVLGQRRRDERDARAAARRTRRRRDRVRRCGPASPAPRPRTR